MFSLVCCCFQILKGKEQKIVLRIFSSFFTTSRHELQRELLRKILVLAFLILVFLLLEIRFYLLCARSYNNENWNHLFLIKVFFIFMALGTFDCLVLENEIKIAWRVVPRKFAETFKTRLKCQSESLKGFKNLPQTAFQASQLESLI